jgi:hypothetical protein
MVLSWKRGIKRNPVEVRGCASSCNSYGALFENTTVKGGKVNGGSEEPEDLP